MVTLAGFFAKMGKIELQLQIAEVVAPSCDSDNQIVNLSGLCQECESYTFPDELGIDCISGECSDDQIIRKDGTCDTC